MRAAVYTRVSTPDQSTDRQRRELRNYAKARGWKIVREMQETVSGASQKRPLREEVMQLASTRAVDVILVQALDRWGRSVQDLILTMAELEALGVAFVVPGQIDMSTPMAPDAGAFSVGGRGIRKGAYSGTCPLGPGQCARQGEAPRPAQRAPRLVNKGLSLIKQGMTYQEAAEQSG